MSNSITNYCLPKEIFNLCFSYLEQEDLELVGKVNDFFQITASPVLGAIFEAHETKILEWFDVAKENRLDPTTILAAVGGIEKLKKIHHYPCSLDFDLIRKDPTLRRKNRAWMSPEADLSSGYRCRLNIYLNEPTRDGATIKRELRIFRFPDVAPPPAVYPLVDLFYCKIITEVQSNRGKLGFPGSANGNRRESSSSSSGYSTILYESYKDTTLLPLIQNITTSLDTVSRLQEEEAQREKEKYQADKNLSCWGRLWKNVSAFFYKIYCFFCPCIEKPPLKE